MKKNTPSKVVHLLKRVTATVKKVKSPDRAQVLQKCINEVCTRLEWPIGHAYFPAEDNPTRLDSSKLWFFDKPDQYKDFRDITETTAFDIGAGLPGRVLTTKKPAWIPDVTKDTNFPRANRAENIGVKAAFAFPVILHSEVVAVLEFFSPLAIEPDEQILEDMENIGKQIGRVIFEAQFRNVKRGQQAVASTEKQLRNSIRPEKLDDYKKWIETIWKEVLRLNSYIHCIKRITEFPFGLLQHNPSPFWTLVKESMCDSLEMAINRITDKSRNTVTLKKFKKEIICHLKNEEYKEQLNKTWDVLFGEIDTDNTDETDLKSTLKKLRHRRNKIIVHPDIDFNINASDEDIKKLDVSLPEIYNLTKRLNSLFQLLNLGHIFRKTALGIDFSDLYYPPDAKDPSDIEILLDTIAKESPVMHMPKKELESWLLHRKLLLHDSQIEIFNKYRKKFGYTSS